MKKTSLKKNDETVLEITDMNALGSGVGKYEGMAVFVPFTAVGDIIRCRIVKVCKNYAYGIIAGIEKASPRREDRGCGVYSKCGGCCFRHISYEEEARIKEKAVRDAFSRVGGFSEIPFDEFIPCSEHDRYRNKAQLPVAEENGHLICGFYSRRSHRVAKCTDCLLAPEIYSRILYTLLEMLEEKRVSAYDEITGKGILRHIFLRRGYHTGEIMLCFVTSAECAVLRDIARDIISSFGEIVSVLMNINPDRTNVILGKKTILLAGREYMTDIMCGVKVRLSLHSFYQVNTAAAELLYRKAYEYAALTGEEEVLDLYCGAGTIGLSMAKGAKKLTGVEIIPDAVENARLNAAENGIEAEFLCADAGAAAAAYAAKGAHPHVIVTDPPRKGCDTDTLDAILKMSPERIVMVSCDVSTAARDIRYLADRGYSLDKVSAADMYAGTAHVEAVALLSRSKKPSIT